MSDHLENAGGQLVIHSKSIFNLWRPISWRGFGICGLKNRSIYSIFWRALNSPHPGADRLWVRGQPAASTSSLPELTHRRQLSWGLCGFTHLPDRGWDGALRLATQKSINLGQQIMAQTETNHSLWVAGAISKIPPRLNLRDVLKCLQVETFQLLHPSYRI